VSKKSRTHATASSAATKPQASRLTVPEALLALACTFVASYLGLGLFGLQSSISVTLPPLAGIIAALACRDWRLAGPIAGIGVIGGILFGAAHFTVSSGVTLSPTVYCIEGVLAAGVGSTTAILLKHRENLERWVAWLGVALTILGALQSGWLQAKLPSESGAGTTSFDLYTSTPTVTADISDVAMWVLTVRRMNAGSDYYTAMGHTFEEINAARPVGAWNIEDPAQYRMPTLYWLLAALPQDGNGWVIAMLVLVSSAIIASWSIASRYTPVAVALTGTTVTSAYLAGFTTINLPQTELWAGLLALVAVALALKSLSVRNNPLAWAGAAAGVALLATLTRELAVAFLIVGLGSTLAHDRWRSRRLWIPWAAALGLAAIAYYAHAQAAEAIGRTLENLGRSSTASFIARHFDPTGRGLVSSVTDMSGWAYWTLGAGWVIWVLGTIGGLIGPRDWPRRALLGGVTAGGAIALFFLHPQGRLWQSLPPGYWGQVVLPTVITCAPLAFARIPAIKVSAEK